jgi:hypothetical protein
MTNHPEVINGSKIYMPDLVGGGGGGGGVIGYNL